MRLIYYVFFFFTAIFITVEWLRSINATVPDWVYFYLTDFLCMPVVLTICLKAVHLVKKDNKITIALYPILALTAVYSLYFELILPRISERYTADFLDVLMYFTGSLLFYFLQDISFGKTSEKNKAA